MRRARVLNSKVLYSDRVFGVRRHRVLEPGGIRATRDVVTHNGSVVVLPVFADGSVLLNGDKTFISNAGIADSYVVFAREAEPSSEGKPRFGAFWLPRESDGLRTTPITVTAPHPIGSVHLCSVHVPASSRRAASTRSAIRSRRTGSRCSRSPPASKVAASSRLSTSADSRPAETEITSRNSCCVSASHGPSCSSVSV